MTSDVEFVIIRHRKENLKKCSLRGFESDSRFRFYTYPQDNASLEESFLSHALVLDMEGEELTREMVHQGQEGGGSRPFVLIDATWRYAQVMISNLPILQKATRCTLPKEWVTAYPRKQTECPDPERGLASIEALYIAALIAGHSAESLLRDYYWKEAFLEKNAELIHRFSF